MRRVFEFVEGTSAKFWAVELKGTSLTVNFGRIGTAGQTQIKSFGSAQEASLACDKLIGEKTHKGYVDKSPPRGGTEGGLKTLTAPAKPAAAPVKPAAASAKTAAAAQKLPAAAATPTPTPAKPRASSATSGAAVEAQPEASDLSWLDQPEPAGVKLPPWLDSAALPPLVAGGDHLTPEQLRLVLATMSQATLAEPGQLLQDLRRCATLKSREAFCWALFQGWLESGASSKERWCMGSLGFLGGDEVALQLTPLVRRWPGESQHQRAVFGLDCLRTIGTDTALMCLSGIAQKLEFKGLKAKAQEAMEGIAASRGMTRAELEDRIVPDCGLDQRGTRVFDYGPRQFRFVLGAEMKPMVKGSDGKLKSDLPAPNAKDGPGAAACLEEWKLLKKQVKEVAKLQAERLEQAMVTGRRWRGSDFLCRVVGHPLLVNLVRLLLWGTSDGQLFRVAEDHSLANQDDAPLSLAPDASVGLVHPWHLSAAQTKAWTQTFSDYELMAPFPQLDRPLYKLEGSEGDDTDIRRYAGVKIGPSTLVSTLEKLAWTRGIPQDAGIFFEHTKPFYGAEVTAVIQYPGVPIGSYTDWEDQHVKRCFFVPGIYKPQAYPEHTRVCRLGAVAPVAVSEVIKDLAWLAHKSR